MKTKRNKRSSGVGDVAKQIRRQMIQRNHGDASKYSRKNKHKM